MQFAENEPLEREEGQSAGAVLCGRYRVLRLLSAGSSSRVFLCRDTTSNAYAFKDLVVIKCLPLHLSGNAWAREKFEKEVELSRRISHPGIVKTRSHLSIDGLPAFIMEYIEGGSLADRLTCGAPLEIAQAVELLIRVCSALQALHVNGIVHQDLKPANILLTREGKPKVSDFGIAFDRYAPNYTKDTRLLGTAHYISPEYLLNGTVDARSDIFSLAVVAYQLLSGQVPFEGNNVFETIALRFKQTPPPLHRINPNVPKKLSRIVEKGLCINPDKRFQSAQEIQLALSKLFRARLGGLFRVRTFKGSTPGAANS